MPLKVFRSREVVCLGLVFQLSGQPWAQKDELGGAYVTFVWSGVSRGLGCVGGDKEKPTHA